MSAGLLATLANEGIIFYNEKTQRGLVQRSKGLEPYLKKSKIKQIYSKLISGELNGSLITLNARIVKDEKGNITNPLVDYDEENHILSGTGKLDAVDGWHRINACQFWLKKWEKNQELPSPWEYSFVTVVENMEESKAGLLFVEYGSTPTKISSSKIKFLDINDYANMIVRNLMNNSQLRGKIEIEKNITKGTNNIVTFSTLNDAIKKCYKIATEDDVKSITNHLILFFNKLINLYSDYFGNMEQSERDIMRKKDNLTLELLMFYGYVSISTRLYSKENWESKLLKLKDVVKINGWEGNILQSNCPLWENTIYRGKDKIVNSSTTRNTVIKIMGDYIEFGIDYILENNKELLEL